MRMYENNGYEVVSKDNSHGLAVYGETIEEIRAEIDRSNARAVSKEYPAQAWAIVRTEWRSWYADNGDFIKRETFTQVVEHYPEKVL